MTLSENPGRMEPDVTSQVYGTDSVGVSLFVVLFRPAFDLMSIAGVVLLTALGLLMIFWPQYIIHRQLSRNKGALWDEARRMLCEGFARLSNSERETFATYMLRPETQQIQSLMRSISSARTWVYDLGDIPSLVASWVLPLVTLAVRELL